jgi:TorA maturation chaperone TorD
MLKTQPRNDEQAIDLARQCVYRFFAAALSDPWSGNWPLLFEEQSRALATASADLLRGEAPECALGFGELKPANFDLSPVLAQIPSSASELRAEYDRIFGLVFSRECPPYETEYYPAEDTFFRSQQLADIAGFYRAFGLEPSRVRPERPDHVALELEFMAFLLAKRRLAAAPVAEVADASATCQRAEKIEVCDEAIKKFFRDHLAWWLPSFAAGLRKKAGSGFYAELGHALAAFVPLERGRMDVAAARLPLRADIIEQPEEQSGCAGCTS